MLATLLLFACADKATDDTAERIGPPISVVGDLDLLVDDEDGRLQIALTFVEGEPTACLEDGCEWALAVQGLFSFDHDWASQTDDTWDTLDEQYEARLEYLPAFEGNPAIVLHGSQGYWYDVLDHGHIGVSWTDTDSADLENLPYEVGGCPDSNGDWNADCLWWGSIDLTW